MAKSCYSPLQCEIIERQIKRRLEYRMEYLKQRTNPCTHSQEAGYVFDTSIQQFMSLKCAQFETFKPNYRNATFAICAIILPMVAYGWMHYVFRSTRENLIRTGKLRYKDRIHKLI